jgi:AbrB family looped-hinge helix DNA binding protein
MLTTESDFLTFDLMTTLVKIHRKGQMTLPTKLRTLAGIAEGDLVRASFQRGKIVITPTLVVDRAKFPNADDEYTPAQKRTIDVRIKEAEKGPYFGPFKNGAEVAAFLKKQKAKSGKSPSR